MKFIKLKLKNFKPYYNKDGTQQEIVLFNEERKDKNITLNIGQTGHGKTSISEAILWCIFGDLYYSNWEDLVNTLSIDIAKQKKDNEVDMTVELVLDIGGNRYRLMRSGSYDIEKGQKTKEAKLSIMQKGVLVPDWREFIGNHFPTLTLMKYFVFDADDILKKFEENREGTIKDHINKIVGVEKLDKTINSLGKVIELYNDEIRQIEDGFHGDIAEKIKEKDEDIVKKKGAIESLKDEIKSLKNDKEGLFKGYPSGEIKKFSELVDKRDDLNKQIYELNNRFIESKIISNMDSILLDCIIKDIITTLSKKQITKEEFETSSALIKSSMGEQYLGLFFDEKENIYLIKKGVKICECDIENTIKLGLGSGEGTKAYALQTISDHKTQYYETKSKFENIRKEFDEVMNKLMNVKNEIRQIGDTTKNRELKEKYEKFGKIEKQIIERKKLQDEIKSGISDIEKEVKNLRSQLQIDEEQKTQIQLIEKKKDEAKLLLDLSKKTRKEFLEELLSYVNKTSSEFLRNTVKDTNRFHSLEIDSNYKFKVKQKNGELLENSQINRGNLQISMMSFFFGLSKFLEKEIPYVIDDPLLRLDPGHDKRLINQLSKTNEQLIFHMIPGKEYTSDSFGWLGPHINTQNWISRSNYMGKDEISNVECKDADKKIDFDINKF